MATHVERIVEVLNMMRITKQTWGRWLAWLLSVAMLLTMLPATALAAEPDGMETLITVQEVQALIDALPDADTITADNRADVEAQLYVIDEAKLWLSDEEVIALDMTRYMAAVSALSLLDAQAMVPSALEQVQALIDALPDPETITEDNRADVEAQLSAIDEAKLWLSDEKVGALDTTRYDAVVSALSSLDAQAMVPSALEQVQALINALPDPESINEDNRADVEAQLTVIDEAKLELSDEDVDALDITRYLAAVEAILALDDMAGVNVPMPVAVNLPSFSGGSGNSEADPYLIESAEQLKALSEYVNGGNSCNGVFFKLMNDIDLNGSEGNQWVPIGNSKNPFCGTLDGGGYTVSGLYIDNSDGKYKVLGLFGQIGNTGTVKNLGISGDIKNEASHEVGGITGKNYGTIAGCHSACTVSSDSSVGGIVGENRGTVSDCYNVGAVSGGSYAGGIVGKIAGRNTVTGCYNTGAVSGNNAGGIAGQNEYSSIENCYNVGKVTGSSSTGGIVGMNNTGSEFSGTCTGCYFLDSTAAYGIGDDAGSTSGVTSKSEEEFKSLASELGDEWMNDPFLGRPVLESNREPSPVAGQGTPEQPFEIPDKETLKLVRDYINKENGSGQYFKLTDDIDLLNEPWTPIGDGSNPFQGTFDGNNHTINGLTVTGGSSVGLFGAIGEYGSVKKLGVRGSVNGQDNVGGIAGQNQGTIEDCYSTVAVSGDSSTTGGIVGSNGGTVKNCYSTGMAGSIAGESASGTVINCYYLSDSDADDSDDGETPKTDEQFASGEVAYLLQSGQDGGGQVWGQSLKDSRDNFPVLTNDLGKKVYKVTFYVEDNHEYAAQYTNRGGTVTLPEDPETVGLAFDHWSTEKNTSGGVKFNSNTPVTEDITVYAVGRETFGGDAEAINLETTYGEILTEDLSSHITYKLGTETAEKFEYNITSENSDDLGATIEGDELKIPAEAKAGDYSLTIEANEKEPAFSLMSVENFGIKSVTLKVKVTIKKANSTVQIAPAAKTGLTYTGEEQELVTAGTAIGGTMQYSLDGISYSPDIPKGTDAETYTVWYKVEGDSNHNDTQPDSVSVTIGKSEAEVTGDSVEIAYGDSVTLTVKVAVKSANGIMLTSAEQDQVVFSFPKGDPMTASIAKTSGENGTASVNISAEQVKNYFNPGPNEVTVSYGGSGNLNPMESMTITVTVDRKALSFTFTATDRDYDGTQTVTGSLKRTTDLVGSDDVTANLQADAATAANAGVGTWDVTVDTSKVELGGSDAAYYQVGNIDGGAVTISKASISSVTAPTANNRIYDGTEMALVTEPTKPDEGTMQYALGDETADDGNYSETIPQKMDAGTYYVWYYAKGDNNHADSAKGCVAVTIEQKSVSVTWKDYEGLIYTGNPVSVTAVLAEGRIVTGDEGNVTVSVTGGNQTDANHDGAYTATAALGGSRAGNYTLTNHTQTYKISKATSSVSVQAVEGTYGDDITITAQVTVSGVNPSLVTGSIELTADGTSLGSATVKDGTATLKVLGTDRDKQHALFGAAGRSSISAVYGGTDNIEGSDASNSATITKRALQYTVTATDRAYEAGKTAVSVTLTPTNLVEGDDVTLTATGNLSSPDAGTYKSVSLTDITMSGEDKDYYTVETSADSVDLASSVTIGKIKAEVLTPPTGNEDLIYNGKPQSLLSGEGTSTGGTMQYYVGAKDSTEQPTETAGWKDAILDITATDAGTYTIWYRAKEDIDYTTSDLGHIEVTIGKATPAVTIPDVSGTYGENITITAEVTAPGVDPSLVTGTIKFTADGTSLGSAAVQNGTATLKVLGADREKQHALFGTEGSSTVTAAYSGNGNISEGTADGTATIGKRELKYTVTATDRAYEPGNTEVSVTLTPTNLIKGDKVTLTATGNLSSADAGTYNSVRLTDIKISGEDKGYYTVETSADSVDLVSPVTISKIKAMVETQPTGNDDLTYTGDPQSLLSGEGTSVGGTMQYTAGEKDSTAQPDETADWKEDIADITAVEAGTYTIWYRANGDGDYATSDLGHITVTIGKATPTVTVPDVTGTYGEDIIITAEVTAPGVDPGLVTGTIKFADGGTTLGTATVENGTATLKVLGTDLEKQHALFGTAGSSTIAAAYSGNGNISEGTADGTATVGQRELQYTVTAADRAYEPDNTEVSVTLTPTNLIEGDKVILAATGNLSSPDAGTYNTIDLTDITMSGTDQTYYTVATSADNVKLTSPATINQAKAKVETPPTGKEDLTYNGKPQNLLSGEGASVGGTMQYYVGAKDSTEEPTEAANWEDTIADITATEAGTYTIWYRANGKANYSTSDLDSIPVTIGKATSTVTIPDVSGTYGEDITITAKVTIGDLAASLITGTVEFKDGSTTLGTATVENGTATLKVPGTDRDKQHALFGTAGSSTVTAAYSGNGNIGEETANGTATISPRTLEYTVTATGREYEPDNTEVDVVLTPTDLIEGDQVTLAATGNLSSAVPNTYESVNLSGITLSGEDARYYTVDAEKTDVALASPVTITGEAAGILQGQVTQDGNGVAGATVSLKQSGVTIETTTTAEDGTYSFENTSPGVYYVVVESEGKTMTTMVQYTEETETDQHLELPTEDVNSVLDTEKAPESVVAVGGLDAAASDHAEPNSTVTVTMTVENKTESEAENAEDIGTAAAGKELEYMSIELKKETTKDGTTTAEPLTETVQLITIVLSFDFTDKDDVTVYRYHGDAVDTLTETENDNDEYIDLDAAGGTITLHVKNFSTYAIGYTRTGEPAPSESPVVPDPPLPPRPPIIPEPPKPAETPAPTEPPVVSYPPIPVEPAPTYYDVTISSESSDSEGGTVTANPKSAQEGSKVTLTVKTDEGYHFVSLTVTDSKGNPVELTDNKDGTYTFRQPAGKVTVEAAFVKCSSLAFTDLDLDAWYHDHIDYVLSHGLMQGIGDNRFAPDVTVSRAQMVTVLWNLRGQPVVNFYMTYSDVTEGTWYAEAVRWATSEGIVSGYGNGAFGPNDPISREQMAAMIYHYEQKYGDGGFTGNWMYRLPFTDLDQISDWAFESVAWCNMHDVISGKSDNLFDPKGFAKRSEMAAILRKYLTQTE